MTTHDPGSATRRAAWETFHPQQVWLAIYRHDSRPANRLTTRVWSFAGEAAARNAFAHFEPHDADVLEAGNEACWTEWGILVRWNRLVIEVFASGPFGTANAEQALYLYALMEKKLTAELAGDPR